MNRYELLKYWMKEHQVTFVWTARQMGLTETGVRKLLMAERMPPNRYEQFLTLHFPVDLLPRPEAVAKGVPRKVPVWEQEKAMASASA